MIISLTENSSYRLWKRLVRLHNNDSAIPSQALSIFLRKYMSTNPSFVNSQASMSWKVMVKINLSQLIVTMTGQNSEDSIDEKKFHQIWQLIHFENMSVFFEKIIELIDPAAPQNEYVISSQSMYTTLCTLARLNSASRPLQLDFLHYICYFYCGTSPGFLHKHEVVLLLQDLCRDWKVIFERLFNFCNLKNSGSVALTVMKARCPTLVLDGSRLMSFTKSPVSVEPVVTRTEFIAYMQTELTAFICNDVSLSIIV